MSQRRGDVSSRSYFLLKLQNNVYDSAFLRLIGKLLIVSEAELSNVQITFDLQLMVSPLLLDRKLGEGYWVFFLIFKNLRHVSLFTEFTPFCEVKFDSFNDR